MKNYVNDFNEIVNDSSFSDSNVIQKAKEYIAELQEKVNRLKVISYNAIVLENLNERYDLKNVLSITDSELTEIMGDDYE